MTRQFFELLIRLSITQRVCFNKLRNVRSGHRRCGRGRCGHSSSGQVRSGRSCRVRRWKQLTSKRSRNCQQQNVEQVQEIVRKKARNESVHQQKNQGERTCGQGTNHCWKKMRAEVEQIAANEHVQVQLESQPASQLQRWGEEKNHTKRDSVHR